MDLHVHDDGVTFAIGLLAGLTLGALGCVVLDALCRRERDAARRR